MIAEHQRRLQQPLDGRNLFFSTITTSLVSSKLVRIYAHSTTASGFETFIWCASFFAQDSIFLLALRYFLLKQWSPSQRMRHVATALASFFTTALLLMAVATISVFAVTGSEIHWQHIGVLSESSGSKMMFSAGGITFALVLASLVLISWLARRICFEVAGAAIDMAAEMVAEIFTVAMNFVESRFGSTDEKAYMLEEGERWPGHSAPMFTLSRALRSAAGFVVLLQLVMLFLHPDDPRLRSLSWTLPLTPFTEASHSLTNLPDPSWSRGGGPLNSTTHVLRLLNTTALRSPPKFTWLPQGVQAPGFEDWYDEGSQHYSSRADPLKVFNLDNKLYPALRKSIANIKIRHVVLLKLESTRSDVFPLENATSIINRLAESYANKTLPSEVAEKLADLTKTAKFLAGVGPDPTGRSRKTGGGIRAHNAVTTASYTLKSLVGTLCGISPLTIDFDLEVSNHIYQPCLAQIFQAFNLLDPNGRNNKGKWKPLFMQSVTGEYDKQDRLMSTMGYANESVITKEYLKGADAKFGPEATPDINYYGMPEVVLEQYIRDAFSNAKQNNERLFLTHLTSTAHHPFKIPTTADGADTITSKRSVEDLSAYLNAIGYVDKWIGKLLDVIDDEGVADETLIVVAGDHGISLPEDNAITPYENPNIRNFRVPLMFYHPNLPKLDIEDAVISSQILPTILDLLLETKSLSKAESRAARDLIENYEGQSLLRPLNKVSQSGTGDWQFTITNPGGTMVSVGDARDPRWRLIVPLSTDVSWRFTDLETDPYEKSPTVAHSFEKLLATVGESYDVERVKWIEEAVLVTKWWVKENRRRWRYTP